MTSFSGLSATDQESRIHIVVSCTNTKRRPPAPGMRVRDLPTLPVKRRVVEWVERLISSETERIPSDQLYAGDHWSTALTLPEIAGRQNFRAQLWVLSAGYGLIPADHEIVPYGATFTSGSPDCVGTGPEALTWWENLATARGIDTGHPRTLAGLALSDPRSRIVVAAALPYLHPIARDTTQAAALLHSDDQLMVVSAGARTTANGLTPFTVPVDSRLLHTVGGSRIALNIRAARFIVENAGDTHLRRQAVSRQLVEHLDTLPPAPTYDRMPMTDEEILRYIEERLSTDPTLSATRMLRDLRSHGKACEQKRFHQLTREARSSHD